MTERIRSNTESTFTDTLSRRISAANAVAIHPDAIRQAATAVTHAEARVADCDADLRDLGPRPGSEEFIDAASKGPEHPAMFDEHTLERVAGARRSQSPSPWLGCWRVPVSQ